MAANTRKRRPKGDGSIQQLKKGKYKVQITIGYDQKGRQIRRSFTGKSQGDAINMLNKFKAEKLQGKTTTPSILTFFSFAYRWLQIKNFSAKAKSYATYKLALEKHICPAFGHYKICKLATTQINDYFVTKAGEGLSTATLRQHRSILYNILNLALSEGLVSHNCVAKAAPLPQVRHEYNILNQQEIKRLLAAARAYQAHPSSQLSCLYHLILLALATGLRRGELLALRWDNVNLTNSTIQIKENLVEIAGKQILDTPKTANSRRIVAVEPAILDILRKDLWNADHGLIFRSRGGRHIPFSTLGRLFRSLLVKAGIEKAIRIHDLRHTHVSHLLAEGYDMKMVSRRIGDDVRTAMSIYAHALPEKDKAAAAFIGEKLLT